MPAITLLVGHRGAGKTALLTRLEAYSTAARVRGSFLDLDEFIARNERMSIERIFAERGEAAFRELERGYLARAMSDVVDRGYDGWIAVGAGFEGPIPPKVEVLWVRRETDASGRVFFDRPRLDPAQDPLTESRRRSRERTPRYEAWADAVVTIPEGFSKPNRWEQAWAAKELEDVGGTLTVLPMNIQLEKPDAEKTFRRFVRERAEWGVRFFELRDDLLSLAQIEIALKGISKKNLLFSFRRDQGLVTREALGEVEWDWAMELGQCPYGAPPILSLHERHPKQSIEDCIARIDAAPGDSIRKLAVVVRDFNELIAGHRWMREAPGKRVFLPRSKDGRWAWYRNEFRSPTGLAFFREGEGSAADQPTLFDWIRSRRSGLFAAVLGEPVSHSWTPAEHETFFATRGLSVHRISVSEDEWRAGALSVLTELGMRFAAVTSPLKTLAFRSIDAMSDASSTAETVNSIRYDADSKSWKGHTTDGEGLLPLLEEIPKEGEIVVWGGGGLLPLLRERLPEACFYAARVSAPRERADREANDPRTLVWATGFRKTIPPTTWKPGTVVDLNYRLDSPARAYALAVGAKYIGGEKMFRAQAEAQRRFFA